MKDDCSRLMLFLQIMLLCLFDLIFKKVNRFFFFTSAYVVDYFRGCSSKRVGGAALENSWGPFVIKETVT